MKILFMLLMLVVFNLQGALFLSKCLAQPSPAEISDELKAMDITAATSIQDTLPKVFPIPKVFYGEYSPKPQNLRSPWEDWVEIVQDKQGIIWILNMSNSLFRYNGKSLKEFKMAMGHMIYSRDLFISRDGTPWLGRTFLHNRKRRAVVNQFDKRTETFKTFNIPIDNNKSVKKFFDPYYEGWQMVALNEDDGGNIWIILDIGIYVLNPKIGKFTHLPLPSSTLIDRKRQPSIHAFAKGKGGEMWIGTDQGLYLYQAEKFTHYRNSITDTGSLSNNGIYDLRVDSAGTLWVQTFDHVLNRFVLATGHFIRIPFVGTFPRTGGWNYETGKAIKYEFEGEAYQGETIIHDDPFGRERILVILPIALLIIIVIGIAFYRNRIRKVRLKASFDKQLAEVSMIALRSQMNPHFLFNSLNSINHFIVKNKPAEASGYLTKFSRLIRLILTNSKSPTVPLAKELEAIQLYIQLENIRFNNRFDYSIEVQEGVDVEFLEIPPLLIQPYVENAIWHGLLHKEGHGYLKLQVYVEDHFLFVVIEDDGVGRKRAQELKSKSATKDKSMGMQITSDRLQMLNKLKQQQATVEITDLEDQEGNPRGTKVILKIPH